MRSRPFRKYIYRDPSTGREYKLWRGEALDRVVRYVLDIYGLHYAKRADVLSAYIDDRWRCDVRLRT